MVVGQRESSRAVRRAGRYDSKMYSMAAYDSKILRKEKGPCDVMWQKSPLVTCGMQRPEAAREKKSNAVRASSVVQESKTRFG